MAGPPALPTPSAIMGLLMIIVFVVVVVVVGVVAFFMIVRRMVRARGFGRVSNIIAILYDPATNTASTTNEVYSVEPNLYLMRKGANEVALVHAEPGSIIHATDANGKPVSLLIAAVMPVAEAGQFAGENSNVKVNLGMGVKPSQALSLGALRLVLRGTGANGEVNFDDVNDLLEKVSQALRTGGLRDVVPITNRIEVGLSYSTREVLSEIIDVFSSAVTAYIEASTSLERLVSNITKLWNTLAGLYGARSERWIRIITIVMVFIIIIIIVMMVLGGVRP